MDQSENSSLVFEIPTFHFDDYTFFIYIVIAIGFILLLAYLFFYNNYYNKKNVEDSVVNGSVVTGSVVNGNDINDIQREVESKELDESE